jgi:hypothetical protein
MTMKAAAPSARRACAKTVRNTLFVRNLPQKAAKRWTLSSILNAANYIVPPTVPSRVNFVAWHRV